MNHKKREPVYIFEIPLKQFVALVIAAAIVLVLFVFQLRWMAETTNPTETRLTGTANANVQQQPPSIITEQTIWLGGYSWRVLEIQYGRMLLLSEYVIAMQPFHNAQEPVTWENSDIRQFLNGEFLETFTPEERARIYNTNVINSGNPWFNTPGSSDTADYVFLLSWEEVVHYLRDEPSVTANHLQDDTWRISDAFNNSRIAYDTNSQYRWWWTRSPGISETTVINIGLAGYILLDGFPVVEEGGIRPAMWVTL